MKITKKIMFAFALVAIMAPQFANALGNNKSIVLDARGTQF